MLIENTDRTPRSAAIALLGISVTHFQRLKAAGVFKPTNRGAYDLKALIAAWAKYHADSRTAGDAAEEKKLLTIAQRKRIELDIHERSRELIPLADAQAVFDEALVIVASQLDGLPGRAAGELAGMSEPAMVRAWLLDEIRRIRNAASERLGRLATAQ